MINLRIIVTALCLVLSSLSLAAGGGAGVTYKAHNDVNNLDSLRRGAGAFMQYCSGCHSAKYVRYQRLSEDLAIPEDLVKKHLMLAGGSIHDTISRSMPASDAAEWFGIEPPDLSLVARSRGTDWLYGYLMTFYADESQPFGVNNLVFPNAAMPHVLSELQGMQNAVFRQEQTSEGQIKKVFDHFEPVIEGSLTPAQYDQFATDVVNFLDYMGEPIQSKRVSIGVGIMGFLLFYFFVALALKKEYWKDIH